MVSSAKVGKKPLPTKTIERSKLANNSQAGGRGENSVQTSDVKSVMVSDRKGEHTVKRA